MTPDPAAARQAIDTGAYERADQLLSEAEELDLAAARQALELAQQAEHFRTAGERVPSEYPDVWREYRERYADALYRQGEERGDNAALEQAIAVRGELLAGLSRELVPLDWAATQNNLGNALSTLDQRESGTVRLEQAVAAFRAALKEWTRERVPLDWAMTQNNLGTALGTIGGRGRPGAA